MIKQVCEKCYRNKPLTDVQKKYNHEKSKIRSSVEHIFGLVPMVNDMGINVQTLDIFPELTH